MGSTALREKKTSTDKTKLNPAARDDTLMSKDTKRSVFVGKRTVFISLFNSDPPHAVQVCVCLFLSQSRGAHWPPLYDWQTELKIFVCVLLKKQRHLHLEGVKQININFSYLGKLSFKAKRSSVVKRN